MSPPDPGPEHTAESDSRFDQFLYDRCCRYMAEKRPFLVESFSLGDLASALYTNKVYLSRRLISIPERISAGSSTTIG